MAVASVDFDRIRFKKMLGRGSFGALQMATIDDRTFVAKEFDLYNKETESIFVKEYRHLSVVQHHNIIQLIYVSSAHQSKYLIMEYAENGTLEEFLHGNQNMAYPTEQPLGWATQCALGIDYLHNIKPTPVIHRDLKPLNLLLSNQYRSLKICNSKPVIDVQRHIQKSWQYIAPEIRTAHSSFTESSDVYSWAIIFAELLSREKPYKAYKDYDTFLSLNINDERPTLSNDLPKCILDIITACWHDEPMQRPSMTTIVTELMDIQFSRSINIQTPNIQHISNGTDKINIVNKLDDVPNLQFNELVFGNIIGAGAFGIVHKATWGKLSVAAKEFDLRKDSMDQAFETEVQQLWRVSHPNIIKIFAFSSTQHSKYLIIELAENGSLHKFLHGEEKLEYSMEQALDWARQCAMGVAYLHNMQPHPILHRDLKPDNLLLTNQRRILKISDFGTVAELRTSMSTAKGTLHWMAPEVFTGGKYTEKCDVFSFGIILWEVLKREKPFKELTNPFAVLHQKSLGCRPPLPTEWSQQIKNLINACWDESPGKRPDMNNVLADLKKDILLHTSPDVVLSECSLVDENATSSNVSASDWVKIRESVVPELNRTKKKVTRLFR